MIPDDLPRNKAEIDQLWADARDWLDTSDEAGIHEVAEALEAESAKEAFSAAPPDVLEVIQGLARLALREVAARWLEARSD